MLCHADTSLSLMSCTGSPVLSRASFLSRLSGSAAFASGRSMDRGGGGGDAGIDCNHGNSGFVMSGTGNTDGCGTRRPASVNTHKSSQQHGGGRMESGYSTFQHTRAYQQDDIYTMVSHAIASSGIAASSGKSRPNSLNLNVSRSLKTSLDSQESSCQMFPDNSCRLGSPVCGLDDFCIEAENNAEVAFRSISRRRRSSRLGEAMTQDSECDLGRYHADDDDWRSMYSHCSASNDGGTAADARSTLESRDTAAWSLLPEHGRLVMTKRNELFVAQEESTNFPLAGSTAGFPPSIDGSPGAHTGVVNYGMGQDEIYQTVEDGAQLAPISRSNSRACMPDVPPRLNKVRDATRMNCWKVPVSRTSSSGTRLTDSGGGGAGTGYGSAVDLDDQQCLYAVTNAAMQAGHGRAAQIGGYYSNDMSKHAPDLLDSVSLFTLHSAPPHSSGRQENAGHTPVGVQKSMSVSGGFRNHPWEMQRLTAAASCHDVRDHSSPVTPLDKQANITTPTAGDAGGISRSKSNCDAQQTLLPSTIWNVLRGVRQLAMPAKSNTSTKKLTARTKTTSAGESSKKAPNRPGKPMTNVGINMWHEPLSREPSASRAAASTSATHPRLRATTSCGARSNIHSPWSTTGGAAISRSTHLIGGYAAPSEEDKYQEPVAVRSKATRPDSMEDNVMYGTCWVKSGSSDATDTYSSAVTATALDEEEDSTEQEEDSTEQNSMSGYILHGQRPLDRVSLPVEPVCYRDSSRNTAGTVAQHTMTSSNGRNKVAQALHSPGSSRASGMRGSRKLRRSSTPLIANLMYGNLPS